VRINLNLLVFACTATKVLCMEQIEISKSALITGLILLISGFVMMALGSDTYSFWKITVSPLIIMIAFCVIAYSVLHKRSNSNV